MDKNTMRGRRGFRPSRRRLIQLYAALLYNANLKGFLTGELYTGPAKLACVPGLNCYSCPAAVGSCPLGALQNALAASGTRAGTYVLGILLLFGLTLGRTICGWLCPMGLLQELLHKIPTPKIPKSRGTRVLSGLKYVVLALFAIAIPLACGLRRGLSLPALCKYICPAGTLEGAVGLLANPGNGDLFSLLGAVFTRKFLILLAVLLACVFCYRSFCRFLCPLGAIYGLFARVALVGVRVDAGRCTGCGACVRRCPMDVRRVGDAECIHCTQCMDGCPERAISFRAGSVTLKAPDTPKTDGTGRKTGRRVLCAAAIAVLCGALLWFNVLDPSGRGASAAAEKTDMPEDFRITCLDGSVFHLEEMRGRVVVVNLWATYCGPCVEEVPLFCAFAEEHGDDVAVLAVHSSLVTEDVAAYVREQGWEIPMAVDTEEDLVWKILDGGTALPQTAVLDREGRIVYNQKGPVTAALLEDLYARAAG